MKNALTLTGRHAQLSDRREFFEPSARAQGSQTRPCINTRSRVFSPCILSPKLARGTCTPSTNTLISGALDASTCALSMHGALAGKLKDASDLELD
jgi:hypothetical protein